jgi:rhamnulokinase
MANRADDSFVAIDLGAGSGRLVIGSFGQERLTTREVHRFKHPMERSDGHLRWDDRHILGEIRRGLREAATAAQEMGAPVRSVGVDSWGVDYGLVDSSGQLVERPVCYRDERTQGAMEAVFGLIPRAEIFERTGIQFLALNTLFQLFVHVREGLSPRAERLLMIPDLFHHFLGGRTCSEYTDASTTQLLDVRTRRWDVGLLDRLGLPAGLMPEIVEAGTDLGPLRADVQSEAGLAGARIVAPGTHDTACAVAGTPLAKGWAYISSGTWSLIGVERRAPLVGSAVAAANFTNEGGVFGTIRFLKNMMGLWILECCRKEWAAGGDTMDYETLLARVAALPESPAVLFPDDERFFNPASMAGAIAAFLLESGQAETRDPTALARIILDSLALRYASIIATVQKLTGQRIEGIHIVGGGSQNAYLNQATADATGLPVKAGPVEATALGNLLVQAIARGRFRSLEEARAYVALNVAPREFVPRPGAFAGLAERYAAIERRFTAR